MHDIKPQGLQIPKQPDLLFLYLGGIQSVHVMDKDLELVMYPFEIHERCMCQRICLEFTGDHNDTPFAYVFHNLLYFSIMHGINSSKIIDIPQFPWIRFIRHWDACCYGIGKQSQMP